MVLYHVCFVCNLNTLLKFVSHYDLGVLSMSVKSLKKLWLEGGWVV